VSFQEPPSSLTVLGWYESIELQSMGCLETSNPTQEPNPMSTSLDLSKLSLMDALDLAILIEEEARQRYKMFAAQVGGAGSGYDAASFFASMAENEAKHGSELLARRVALFGKVPMKVKLVDLYDVEAPDSGAPRRGMSTIQAFEVGLAAEKKAYDFYDMALPGITDPEVRTLFTELRDEETEHVEMLREAMAKLPPSASVETENDPDDAPYL
jgi:rubrerythrin